MTDILDLSNWTVLDAKHGDELIVIDRKIGQLKERTKAIRSMLSD